VSVLLLISLDLGMRKLLLAAAEELLEIIRRRYKRASKILTSSLDRRLGQNCTRRCGRGARRDCEMNHGYVVKCGPRC